MKERSRRRKEVLVELGREEEGGFLVVGLEVRLGTHPVVLRCCRGRFQVEILLDPNVRRHQFRVVWSRLRRYPKEGR